MQQRILPLMLSFKENQKRHAMGAMEGMLKFLFTRKLNKECFIKILFIVP